MLSGPIARLAHQRFVGGVQEPHAFFAIGMVSGALFAGAMHIIDGARPFRKLHGLGALRDVSLVWPCVGLLIVFLAFSLKAGETLSRITMFSFLGLGYVAIVFVRSFVPPLMGACSRWANAAGRHAVVIGARGDPAVDLLIDDLLASGHRGPTRIEADGNSDDSTWSSALPVLLDKIHSSSHKNGHGDICIVAGGFSASRLRDITDSIVEIPRAVHVVPNATVEALLHLPVQGIGRFCALEFQKPPMSMLQRAIKRALDLVISILLLAFIAPFLATIAIAIKLDSRGPIIFTQKRLGYCGRPFSIFKFRTMYVLEDGPVITQAGKDDERVTRVGRWLRRTSIDELPQLLNVILGTMSLVGPRPHAVAHDVFYRECVKNYDIRQHVMPGITGWAQVNGQRGGTASLDVMRRRVECDIWYAKNVSLWLDIKILILTAIVVIRQHNAY